MGGLQDDNFHKALAVLSKSDTQEAVEGAATQHCTALLAWMDERC